MKKERKEPENKKVEEENIEPIIEEGTESDAGQKPKAEEADVVAELNDRLQRTMADFDNFRKRTQKERAGMRDEGVRDVVEKLLPIIDNFERAMQAPSNPEDNFYKGVQMIFKQFIAALTDAGVEEIPALGESFNPELHFAVSHLDDEKYGDNEIIEVLQKGYRYNDRIIRPSMVRVAN